MKNHAFNILIAEDDPAISLVVATLLRRMGHTVEVAHDGKEAIVCYSTNPGAYEVLITDHDMPNVNGLELIQHLRKNGFDGRIVVMSGSLTEELLVAYRSRRVHKILQKPFTVESLSTTLRELLAQWNEEHTEA